MRRTSLIIAAILALVILIAGVAFVINGQSQTRPGPTPLAGASASPVAVATPTNGGVAAGATASPTAGAGPSVVAAENGALQAQPGDTTVQLSWQAQAGASGYLLFRDGAAAPLELAPTTATQYLDIGLTNGRTYTYTVALLNQAGQPGARLGPVAAAPRSH